jgi:hypothetical protein
MNQKTVDPTRMVANPADSALLSLARVLADSGTSVKGNLSWPQLDLSDARQREFGDYELLEEIGRGGMGVVYRARQHSLDRHVAIKFIADWFADPARVGRFLAEARAAARLMHPNIVPVHEVGSVEGLHYFSMPLVEGRSLALVLDDKQLSTDAMIALMLKLCEALDYAHRLGLLHLDLKPANVLLDERNEPLIADFGLARHMDANGGVDAQEVSGTPSFMAPEQILIKQYRLTRPTDIYALGAILYLCLTGQSPHGEGAADDILRRAVAGRIRAPRELNPNISRDLDAICMKCLELQPADRYKTAAGLAEDLRRVRDDLPVSVRKIGYIERVQRWFKREPRLAFATTFAALTLIVGAAATAWQWRQAVAERDRATIASEIGAHLFAYKGEDNKRAEDLIDWLRNRLPGDENRQADALAAFAASVDAEGRETADPLFARVTDVLGADYRRQMIQALSAGSDPYRHLYIALLAWRDEHDSADPKTFASSLQAALDEHPDDPLVWHVAAVYCPGPRGAAHCVKPQAAETLTRLDPENMFSWLLLAMTSTDAQRARDALHAAAARTRFDDHLGATDAAYAKAVDIAAVPAPPLIARPLRILAPNERVASNIALAEAEGMQLPPFQRFIDQCGVRAGATPITDSQVRADCLTVGMAMVRSNGGLMTRMIGIVPVRALAKGTPEAEEAAQVRRLYTYLEDVYQKLNPSQRASYPSSRHLEDIATAGEMVALQRRARFFGLPDQPPADWIPDSPTALQTTRERLESAETLNRNAANLVAQGKYADAVALLAPAEKTMHTNYKSDWHGVRYLTVLAKARTGLHDFYAAQAALDDAWYAGWNFGPTSRDTRDCARAYVDLYTAWNTTEPGKGYDLRMAEWQRRLDGLEAAKDD